MSDNKQLSDVLNRAKIMVKKFLVEIVEIALMLVAGLALSALGWGIILACWSLYDNDDSGGRYESHRFARGMDHPVFYVDGRSACNLCCCSSSFNLGYSIIIEGCRETQW